ncbi:head maturation protease, ClpP-related [Lacticaseibacillus saniviri]
MKLQVKGTIVSNSEADVYRWYGYEVTSPKDIILPETNEPVDIEINSGGGDVFAGAEIYTALRGYQGLVNISVVGVAASAASLIAMAGDSVKISPVGMIMIHNAASATQGNANEHEHTADVLNSLSGQIAESYAARTGRTTDEFKALMDKETWFTAKDAVEAGLADEVMFADEKVPAVVASIGGQLSPEALAKGRKVMTTENKPVSEMTAFTTDQLKDAIKSAIEDYKQTEEPRAEKQTGFLF